MTALLNFKVNLNKEENIVINPTSKILSLEQLKAVCLKDRLHERKIVHCHGVFDLLHLGHVRHFKEARSLGDVLVVTLTADAFVNKGPGRPVFNEIQRAEMLASLEYIDYVAINHAPDAENVIHAVQPDLYIKGTDYANAEEDVTGKIVDERRAVESFGGKIHFTNDVTFSSSTLINKHLNIFEPKVREYLDLLRADGGLDEILSMIESIKDYKVLLVGDCIIDEYDYVTPMAKSAKENIIATRYQDREVFAGGVIAAANHVASFCKEVEIITVLGEKDSYEDVIRSSLLSNVKLSPLHRDFAPTTRKVRFVDPNYTRKMFEVYYMDDSPMHSTLQKKLNEAIMEKAKHADVVIITDFGHSLIDSSTVDVLVQESKFLAVNVQTNSANIGFNLIDKYPKADYVCIDEPEARLATRDKQTDITDIICTKLPEIIDCKKIIITHGKHGCITHENDFGARTIPALTKTVVDTVGAGDAFLAVTSPLVAAGHSLQKIGFIGNIVGSMKVGIVGHRKSVDKASVIKAITALLK